MTTTTFRVMLDNSTIAGAGRALYDTSPDISDCRSLMHLITTTLLCDEIYIDGSSREIPVRIYDAGTDEDRLTEPLPMIWTWENRYPAIKDFCYLVDGFWQRMFNFNKDKIVDFVLKVLCEGGTEHIKHLDLQLIPSIYLSDNYFDREWLVSKKALFDSHTGNTISESAFKVLLYAWRGIYYYELSKLLEITYFAHPQRSQFLEPFLVSGKSIYDYDSTALNFISKAICSPTYRQIQALVPEKSKEFAISLFPFAAYVLKNCKGSRKEIVDFVAIWRDSDQLKELRGWIREYNEAYRQTNLLNLKKFQSKINSSMSNFEKRCGLESVPLTIVPRIPLNAINISGLDQVSASMNLPGFLFTELFQKPYLSLMWDLAKGLLSGDRGLDKIPQLTPISDHQRDTEWILMEAGARSLLGKDYYFKGHVAGPGAKNLHGYDSYEDLLAASTRPAQIVSLTAKDNTSPDSDTARMDALRALDEIAQTRKLQPEENEFLLNVLAEGSDREKMTASGSIEMSGSPEAVKALLAWENEYIRRQLGYAEEEEEICPPTKAAQHKTKKKRQTVKTKGKKR